MRPLQEWSQEKKLGATLLVKMMWGWSTVALPLVSKFCFGKAWK
jgi:hypothetical protein